MLTQSVYDGLKITAQEMQKSSDFFKDAKKFINTCTGANIQIESIINELDISKIALDKSILFLNDSISKIKEIKN